jgi:diguanylate cyclase
VESELANALADSRHVAQASSELTARLDSEVTAIDRAVNGDLPVSELRALIDARVQSMRSAMTDYVSAQQIRQADYERRLSDFGSRVQQFEKESALLREGLLAAQERSHRDALTQLPNRLAFDERAHLELQRARRSGVALTLAVLDLDHFKRINDRFGHKIGDRVLKHAALLFQRRTRATDFLARYGGEEFVILYADTRLDEAYRAAEELRARLELATFQYRGERVPVTVSIGMAGLQLGEAMDRLFERADLALYDAKKLGRNRIVTA